MRRFLAVIVSTVVGFVLLPTTPGAQASPTLEWVRCQADGPGEDPPLSEVQCARLRVPVDWQRDGATIELSLVRRQATGDRIGTIVYLPGGPGDSGVRQLVDRQRVSPDAAARFDVVSLDPRGTNGSSPVRCDPGLIGALPNVNPDTGAKLADVQAHSRKLAATCQSDVIGRMDSRAVARDVEAIRTALGERRISVYSRSYGTLAAQAYAEMYPHRVRTMVLDSVFDHSLGTREFMASSLRATEDAFDEFVKWCAASTNCALHGQDLNAVFGDLYRRAERGELVEPADPTRNITPTDLSWQTMRAGFYTPAWAQISGRLAELAGQRPPSPVRTSPPTDLFPVAVLCADHRFGFRSEQDWNQMWDELKRMAPNMRTHMGWLAVSLCSGWPFAVTNPQHRPNIKVPLLILNSAHDPATSMEWAVNVNRMIPRSVLVAYDGAGHGVYLRNDCTEQTADHYLIGQVLPPSGTRCPGSDPA